MANGNANSISIEKRAEFFRDFIQTVLGLGAGSVVFSVTFLRDVIPVGEVSPGHVQITLQHPRWLLASWTALLVSVIASLVYLYHHAVSTKYESAYSTAMARSAKIACGLLVVGLALLIVFGFLNLPA